MRVLVVVQRTISIAEPWLFRMVRGLGTECVGVAGRTDAGISNSDLGVPYKRLRSRNLFHRVLPRSLREKSPYRPAKVLEAFGSQQKADRILCNYGTVAVELAEAWDLLKLPLFVHFHGFDFMFNMKELDGSGKPIHDPSYQGKVVALSHRATLIANSEFCRTRLVTAGVSPDRVVVHYLGVQAGERSENAIADVPVILHVGRFVDCKGPDRTIAAFNLLRESGTDAKLVMVGDGPERERCLELAAKSPFSADIELPGVESYEAVSQRLKTASIFSMHSKKGDASGQEEAFGVAFLDAMAAGLPVVTGRSGGIAEIVEHEKTGFLFRPGDVHGHADYLRQLVEDRSLSHRMGIAGWERVNAHFTQERSDATLRDILNIV